MHTKRLLQNIIVVRIFCMILRQAETRCSLKKDFFYYLEKTIGNFLFYKPMFAALGLKWGSDMPISVYAVDKVLKESFSGSASNLADSWYRFSYDMAIESSSVGRNERSAEPSSKVKPRFRRGPSV